jgi:predicted nucleic acid-binding Zn ribbon protein
MMIQFTCDNCQSSVEVVPKEAGDCDISCEVCQHHFQVKMTADHVAGVLKVCPKCERQDFYKQKDFNRKIGVILFVLAAIASIWTYGLSFVFLWVFDLMLYKKLGDVGICYKCQTNFRKISNISDLRPFDHEMNDRIIYSDQDFKGQPLSH